MQWRKIKTKLFFKNVVIYRLSVIAIQTMFFWIMTGKFKFAIGTSLSWNVINVLWYILYHYVFLKTNKVGK